jgi:hypothetical protein
MIPPGTSGSTDAISNGFVVTPSDTENLPFVARSIHLSADGTVKMDLVGGATEISLFLVGGVAHPYRPSKIYATGTDDVTIFAGM